MTAPDHEPVLAALAAITGQSTTDVVEALAEQAGPGQTDADHASADRSDVASFVARVKTRIGLAPAVDTEQAAEHRGALDAYLTDRPADRPRSEGEATRHDLAGWDTLLRRTPEHVPTLARDPVAFPILPEHQTRMWQTLFGIEALGHPWVLVGGQMTMLHCLENGITQTRPTDDGDIVVGVWTRRDALRKTASFLRSEGFEEERTSDGYGYRFTRGRKPHVTTIDVLLPEGVHDQRSTPTSTSGRPGLPVPGANQALTRAVRVPIIVPGRDGPDLTGTVRRPTILGSIVAKAHAWVVDSRDTERHAEDLVTLASIALTDPRSALRDARPGDRRPVRRFLRDRTPADPCFRGATDPDAVHRLLDRLANPPR